MEENKMKLRIDGALLKSCISQVNELVSEVQLIAGLEDIRILEMDPANVAMADLRIFKSACLEYEVPQEERIALNLSNLKVILKRTKKDDLVLLETLNNQLIVKIGGNRTFNLPLLADKECKEQKWPEIDLPAKVKMSTQIFNESLDDLGTVSETALFEVTPIGMNMIGEGDLSIAKVEMKASDSMKISGEFEKVKTKFAMEYLKKMVVKHDDLKEVTLEFKTDSPIRISYATDRFSLKFLLAPRCDSS
jgi:proliferating cell nuclear antigen PCNA